MADQPTNRKRLPFFLVDEFDSKNPEHMSGNLTLKMNPVHAYDLCELISEIELDKDEGHIHAMVSQIRRWFAARKEAVRKAQNEKYLAEKSADTVEVKTASNTGC